MKRNCSDAHDTICAPCTVCSDRNATTVTQCTASQDTECCDLGPILCRSLLQQSSGAGAGAGAIMKHAVVLVITLILRALL